MKESFARYPSLKGYAIDWNQRFQWTHSYTLLHNTGSRAYMVYPSGRTSTTDCLSIAECHTRWPTQGLALLRIQRCSSSSIRFVVRAKLLSSSWSYIKICAVKVRKNHTLGLIDESVLLCSEMLFQAQVKKWQQGWTHWWNLVIYYFMSNIHADKVL